MKYCFSLWSKRTVQSDFWIQNSEWIHCHSSMKNPPLQIPQRETEKESAIEKDRDRGRGQAEWRKAAHKPDCELVSGNSEGAARLAGWLAVDCAPCHICLTLFLYLCSCAWKKTRGDGERVRYLRGVGWGGGGEGTVMWIGTQLLAILWAAHNDHGFRLAVLKLPFGAGRPTAPYSRVSPGAQSALKTNVWFVRPPLMLH